MAFRTRSFVLGAYILCTVLLGCLLSLEQPWIFLKDQRPSLSSSAASEMLIDNDKISLQKPPGDLKLEATFQATRSGLSSFNLTQTKFTPHIMEILSSINQSSAMDCPNYYKLQVESPLSVPTILGFFGKNNKRIENEWTQLLTRIFSRPGRVLYSNITFGTTWGDYNNPFSTCIGSSSPGGNMTMMNFLNIKQQVKASPTDESVWGNHAISWESRNKTPIFRGTGYGTHKNCTTFHSVLSDPDSVRLKAVDFSIDNPSLLNARLSSRSFRAPCWKLNATNGLQKLILVDDIPAEVYYTHYQVALVLGGIGAAFRLGTHLSTGTAVVLQQFKYEEWFTKLLQPYVHYVPLDEDLENLNEAMQWVRDHPVEVKAIGSRGQEFYHEFLSFSQNEEHLYELLFRLSYMSLG